jgi:hypothetical protein
MVVVLNNLGVITGEVTQIAEGLRVRTAMGSTTILRFDQVVCLAESMDAAFEHLASAADLSAPQDLERLFDWCLRNGLKRRAAELLERTAAQGVGAARIQLMRRRLKGMESEEDRQIRQTWPSEIEHSSQKARVDAEQIAEAVDALPRGAEAFFNQQLHSKLVVGCAAANCHSRDCEKMAIWHHGKGVVTPRGLTRHNLYHVLQYIDLENPADSKLLAFALAPHGGQSTPTFSKDDLGFQLLQSWVYSISRYPERYLTEVIQQGHSPPASLANNSVAPQESDGHVAPVGFVESASSPTAPPQPTGKPEQRLEPAPSDPCDPMLFNRRHHPDRSR